MKKTFLFLFYLLAGIILGSLLASVCVRIPGLAWLGYSNTIGFAENAPAVLNLLIIRITLGFSMSVSVAQIINTFPLGCAYDRKDADTEIAYREKRLASLRDEPLLYAAYELFLSRLKEMPLTLANGDFLPINCIYDGTRVYIIDWEYGGFLPYALDIGRFLAHSGEHRVFPYRMTEAQKVLFCDRLYEALSEKPPRSVFDRDVQLAVFDEWIMVVGSYLRDPSQKKDETFSVYYEKAEALAKELLS